jgi:DNA adenine methylase
VESTLSSTLFSDPALSTDGESGRLTPPLKWHGGKTYLASRIIALMPPHLHYAEVFAGGLAVLLARDPEDPRLWAADTSGTRGVSEVVNDIDTRLTNFWRVLRDEEDFAAFLRAVQAIPLSRSEWEWAKAHTFGDHTHGSDAVGDAVAFFVCCRQSLAGRMKAFTALTRTRTRRGMNGNASEWAGAVDGLPAVHARLRRVVVENQDFRTFIPREDTPGTLFYCDPPYLHETRSAKDVYRHEMSSKDHRELLKLLRAVKGKVMLSGYPSPLYNDALKSWNQHTFDMPNHAAGGKAKGLETEVVWCNF